METGTEQAAGPRRPRYFWWLAGAALLWNLAGVAMLLVQVGMDAQGLAALDAGQRRIREATPGWVDAAFAVAVTSGVLGALGLLLRGRWAAPLFGVSLLAMLVQLGGGYATTPAWEVYGPAGLAMPAILLVIAVALWGYARRLARSGWLR